MPEEIYQEQINEMRNEWKETTTELEFIFPNGNKEYEVWGYEIPWQTGKYIFTAKITNEEFDYEKEFKFKVTIDEYEIAKMSGYSRVVACDIQNRKLLKIDRGKSILNGITYEIKTEDIINEGTYSYISKYDCTNYEQGDGYFKLILNCNSNIIEGYNSCFAPV